MYESDGYEEEDWYELRGTNSLRYHYSKEDLQYILQRSAKKQECCSLHTSFYDTIVSALSFAGYQLFPPCKNLLARNFIQNAAFDSNKLAQNSVHTQKRMAHKPSGHEVMRAKQRT